MRTFFGLILLSISVAIPATTSSAQGAEARWLARFTERIDPRSEPAKRLANLEATASERDTIQVLAGTETSRKILFTIPALIQ